MQLCPRPSEVHCPGHQHLQSTAAFFPLLAGRVRHDERYRNMEAMCRVRQQQHGRSRGATVCGAGVLREEQGNGQSGVWMSLNFHLQSQILTITPGCFFIFFCCAW